MISPTDEDNKMKYLMMIVALTAAMNASAGYLRSEAGVGLSYYRSAPERQLTQEEREYIAKERGDWNSAMNADRQRVPVNNVDRIPCDVQVQTVMLALRARAIETNDWSDYQNFNYDRAMKACQKVQ
ncbi:hypothetical protein [Yersinia phage MHG19]|nr:hypothetical protein [Yersinia phage MHG19]